MKTTLSRGFTIVELLVVIVVIGILAGLAMNAFSNVQQKARNAQTTSLVRAYYTAIQAYAAENGTYPPDWACLGTGYPDGDGNGIAGDCEGDASGAWIRENPTFNAAIRPYIGNGENKVNPKSMRQAAGGMWTIGAMYTFNATATLDGQPQQRWLLYNLEGRDSKCTVGPIARHDTWPAFSTGSYNGVSENWWPDSVRCWIPLK